MILVVAIATGSVGAKGSDLDSEKADVKVLTPAAVEMRSHGDTWGFRGTATAVGGRLSSFAF